MEGNNTDKSIDISEIEKQRKNRECQYNGQTNKIDKHLIRLVRKKRLKLLEIKEKT